MTTATTPGASPAAPAANPAAPAGDPATNPQATTPANPAADPAPAAAPAAPAEPAPEVIGADPAPAAADSGVSYQPTGDAGLDIALGFIGKLGLGPDHDAVLAAADGNFDKLEATLAAMGDKATGYEPYVKLAKDAYERNDANTKATQTKITAAVTEAAGGADQWATVKKWAGENANADEKAEINAMLAAGPVQARAAALMLTNLYKQAGGTVVTPASVTDNNAGNGTANSGALTAAEYASEVRALRSKLGSRMEGSPEYHALRQRRLAAR